MKQCKLWLCAALVVVLWCTLSLPVSALGWMPDIEGHWAEGQIRQAAGWVSGYPDGTFRPDGQVTRAELVKLLLQAAKLDPGFEKANYLHQVSAYDPAQGALTDLDSHWLTTYGWTQVALDFGLIQPADYADGIFAPDQPATRQETALLIVRMLGLVHPARQWEGQLPFTDSGQIPQWLQGYISQAMEAGALTGYPDGSFQGGKTVTRAEAVTMIARAMETMEQGMDPGIRVFVRDYGPEPYRQQVRLWLSAPAQLMDGMIYLPARDVIAANAALYGVSPLEQSSWDPVQQQLALTYTYPFQCGAGDDRYLWFYGAINETCPRLPAPARLLYGQLMIPVYAPGQPGLWSDAQWDPQTKTLVIPMSDHGPIGS